ncbi:MAG TPA: histidine phosphatase family protein [Actinobacteria bacterium]|nr:histidine phosphatase family protein [Actinomycetota bacterium]
MPSASIVLVRHGEVDDPGHVVYADLDGFGLSERGRRQALDLADRLAAEPIGRIVTSPLLRARETAEPLARRIGISPVVEDRLTEWGLTRRWAGTPWEAVPERFPGELEAYLSDPTDLPFAPESLEALAERMVEAIGDHLVDGVTVFVSHQDPIQAARLVLVGRPLAELHDDKPDHASPIHLERHGDRWREVAPPHSLAAPYRAPDA